MNHSAGTTLFGDGGQDALSCREGDDFGDGGVGVDTQSACEVLVNIP